MTRRYQGQIRPGELLAGVAVVVLGVVAIVLLTAWLVPPGEAIPELEAPSGEDAQARPGAVDCARAEDLPPGPLRLSASELIDCPDVYGGRTVAYEGEVIEVVVTRGDGVVAFLNDDPYAQVGPLPETRTALGGNAGIAVSLPREMQERIRFHGSHRSRGDIVRVLGTYEPAATSLGGQPAIIAEQARVARRGREIDHRTDPRLAVVALLFGLGTVLLFLSGRGRDRQ